jgi:hypothetical protein
MYRDQFGRTPLSLEERQISWDCRRLMIGSGDGARPVTDDCDAKRYRLEAGRKTLLQLLRLDNCRGS